MLNTKSNFGIWNKKVLCVSLKPASLVNDREWHTSPCQSEHHQHSADQELILLLN